jgi:RNA polymerase sigma-70 factor (ECF subfamily)
MSEDAKSGLALAFLRARGGSPGRAPPGLQESLASLCAAGRAAWPELELGEDEFVHHLAAVTPPEADLPAPDLHAGDLWLACACAAGEPRALELLSRRFLSSLPAAVARIDASAAFGDEVGQIVRERLLVAKGGEAGRIAEYRGQGPLEGWLRVTAVRVALRLKRQQKPAQLAGQEEAEPAQAAAALEPALGPELDYIKRRYRPDFEAAFRESMGALSGKPRTILRLHHVEGLSIDRIGAHYGVHRATAARWIIAAREELLQETRRRLMERLQLGETELDSLMRLVASQLEVSMNQLVRD